MGSVATDDYKPGVDSHFHTDYTFDPHVPDFAVLRADVVPTHGGDTMWASTTAAFDALSPSLQSFLQELDAFHSQGPVFNDIVARRFGEEAARPILERFAGTTHPVVTVHPETGRNALFVNQGYTQSIVGLHADESDALLAFLFAHVRGPRFVCRYRWAVGDVAIWDERSTVHMGEGTYWPQERLMRRVTVGRAVPRRCTRVHRRRARHRLTAPGPVQFSSAARLSAANQSSIPACSFVPFMNSTRNGPAIDSSLVTVVVPFPSEARTLRCTALAPAATPVHVISRPGSTTANRDFIRARPFDHRNRVSTAVGASGSTSWMPGSHDGHRVGSLNSAQTVSTGASISTRCEVRTGARSSTRPRLAYSSWSVSIDGPR